MTMQTLDVLTEHLTEAQAATFHSFREKLQRRSPRCRITAVEPLKENIIRVWLDGADLTYQMVRTAAKLAVEVEEKTGVYIILR